MRGEGWLSTDIKVVRARGKEIIVQSDDLNGGRELVLQEGDTLQVRLGFDTYGARVH